MLDQACDILPRFAKIRLEWTGESVDRPLASFARLCLRCDRVTSYPCGAESAAFFETLCLYACIPNHLRNQKLSSSDLVLAQNARRMCSSLYSIALNKSDYCTESALSIYTAPLSGEREESPFFPLRLFGGGFGVEQLAHGEFNAIFFYQCPLLSPGLNLVALTKDRVD